MKSGRKVIKLAGDVSPQFEMENIHKIRTTIKKMRAIGDWAGMSVKQFFRNNYRILGNIRDRQLLLSRIKNGEYVAPKSFTDWLESGLHHFKAEWQKTYDRKKIKQRLKKLEEKLDAANQHNKKHSIKFEKRKEQMLTSFIHDRPLSDDQIHSGRKTIKEIDFLNKWEKKNSDVHLKKLSDETGNYIDKISAINLLEKYIAEETDELRKNEAQSVLENWKAQKDKEKTNLFKSIDLLPA